MPDKKPRQKPKPKDDERLPTMEELENVVKKMFDEADKKAGLDKRKGWKPRVVKY